MPKLLKLPKLGFGKQLKMPKCRNAETAKTAETAEMPKLFRHFGIVSAQYILIFNYSFGIVSLF
jgi:hypothetical protein